MSATHVYWNPQTLRVTDVIDNGRGLYSRLTVEQLNTRECAIHEIISLEEAGRRQAAADRLRYCHGPAEVTAERADEALNCLPPYGWRQCSGWEVFAIGEPITDVLLSWFVRIGERWFELVEDRRITAAELVALVRASSAFTGEA